jgi:hypothetical protein
MGIYISLVRSPKQGDWRRAGRALGSIALETGKEWNEVV